MRTYLQLFGGLAPADVQKRIKLGSATLFDTWNDYLSALGLPDYRLDLPRAAQTSSLMLATFERLGVALCDKAVERDLRAGAGAAANRPVFAFDLPSVEPDLAAFTTRFDSLHRTFLGYPAALAGTSRTARFYTLYTNAVAAHAAPGAAKSAFTASEAGWASVCYGLVRHPEFHLY